jgi:hypothetical protein
MSKLYQFRRLLATFANFVAVQPSLHFTCGDCERNARCGPPPHDDCVFRIMQIARDGDRLARRSNYLYPAI